MSTTTKQDSSSTISVTCWKSFWTNLPLSLNHFEKSECELISTSLARSYLSQSRSINTSREMEEKSLLTSRRVGWQAFGPGRGREKSCQCLEGRGGGRADARRSGCGRRRVPRI